MFEFAEFFASLTKGVKAAIPYFRAAVSTDLSVEKILSNAKEAGFAFRRQQAIDVIQVLRGNVVTENTTGRAARVSGPDTPIHPSLHGLTIGKPLKNFSYTVKRTLRGLESGEHDTSFVTVTSNSPLSRNQILDTAAQYTTGSCNPLFEEVETVDMEVTEALRSPSYAI